MTVGIKKWPSRTDILDMEKEGRRSWIASLGQERHEVRMWDSWDHHPTYAVIQEK